ncbi:DinB family protein [Psychrobacillus sp. NPDC096389]|uniref:DinB family protein n=1 Tax=Psychrobacillus sp. NPDC096389 TaxID=3364490 RepID=UPI003826CE9C
MFLYNWQIREDWFKWCETISNEELLKRRVGGMGSIIQNLFHVIDCEQIWVNQMQGTPVIIQDIHLVSSLKEVKEFSNVTKTETLNFIQSYFSEGEEKSLIIQRKNGTTKSLSFDKIISHIISHEIHHIGQLSIWSREIGMKPVSSDLIFRDIF